MAAAIPGLLLLSAIMVDAPWQAGLREGVTRARRPTLAPVAWLPYLSSLFGTPRVTGYGPGVALDGNNHFVNGRRFGCSVKISSAASRTLSRL